MSRLLHLHLPAPCFSYLASFPTSPWFPQDVKQSGTKDGTCACSLLWLKRAMQFLVAMIDELAKDPSKTLSAAVTDAYENTLKPFHGRMVQTMMWGVTKGLPGRDHFEQKLGGNIKGPAEGFVNSFGPLLQEIHAWMVQQNLNDPKKA